MSNIKYFSIAKTSNWQSEKPFIHQVFGSDENKDDIQKETKKVLAKVVGIDLKANERQKIKQKNGAWYTKVDEQNIAYIVLASQNYPEYIVYDLIAKLQEQLVESGGNNYGELVDSELKRIARNNMENLRSQYDNLAAVSKLHEAQNKVEDVKVVMQDNIADLVNNNGKLTDLQDATVGLNEQAEVFKKDSHTLERIMYWRKIKLNIIIGIVILSVLLYIIVPIIVSKSKSKKDEEDKKDDEGKRMLMEVGSWIFNGVREGTFLRRNAN